MVSDIPCFCVCLQILYLFDTDVEDLWRGVEAETDMVYDIFDKWKVLYGDPTEKYIKSEIKIDQKKEKEKEKKALAYVDVIVENGADLEVKNYDLKISAYCVVLFGINGRYKT